MMRCSYCTTAIARKSNSYTTESKRQFKHIKTVPTDIRINKVKRK